MSIFRCDNCGALENTATSRFWFRIWTAEMLGDGKPPLDGKVLCSECDPAIGKWHGIFPREFYDPERHYLDGPYVRVKSDGRAGEVCDNDPEDRQSREPAA